MTIGKLGSANITTPGTDVKVYTVPTGKAATYNIRVCNRTAASIKIRIAVGSGVSPALEDYIDYDVPVGGNAILEDSGIVSNAGENVWVQSDTAGVSVRVNGFEEIV